MITLNITSYVCPCGYHQDFPGSVCPSCGGELAKGESKCSMNIMEQSDKDAVVSALQSEPLRDIPTGEIKKFANPETWEITEVPQTRKETQEERDAEIAQIQNAVLLTTEEVTALTTLLTDAGLTDEERTEALKPYKETFKSLREKGYIGKDIWY